MKIKSQMLMLPPFLQTLPYFQAGFAVALQPFVAPRLLASSEIQRDPISHIKQMQITASVPRLIP